MAPKYEKSPAQREKSAKWFSLNLLVTPAQKVNFFSLSEQIKILYRAPLQAQKRKFNIYIYWHTSDDPAFNSMQPTWRIFRFRSSSSSSPSSQSSSSTSCSMTCWRSSFWRLTRCQTKRRWTCSRAFGWPEAIAAVGRHVGLQYCSLHCWRDRLKRITFTSTLHQSMVPILYNPFTRVSHG